MENRHEVPRTERGLTSRLIVLLLVLEGGLLASVLAILLSGLRQSHETARQKSCFANQRVILGAVEMYNMDAAASGTPSIGTWTGELRDLLNTLKERGSLPEVQYPLDECGLFLSGDVTASGFLYCRIHGMPQDICDAKGDLPPGFFPGQLRSDLPGMPHYTGNPRGYLPGGPLLLCLAGPIILAFVYPVLPFSVGARMVMLILGFIARDGLVLLLAGLLFLGCGAYEILRLFVETYKLHKIEKSVGSS